MVTTTVTVATAADGAAVSATGVVVGASAVARAAAPSLR